MDTLLSAAHLKRGIGDRLFAVLVSSDNTAAVRKFAQELVWTVLPNEMTVGGRVYEIRGFLQEGEMHVKGDVMVGRAKKRGVHQGKGECDHLLDHQEDIPITLRDEVTFVFVNWLHPNDPGLVACVGWLANGWIQYWRWLSDDWYRRHRVLRRKSK